MQKKKTQRTNKPYELIADLVDNKFFEAEVQSIRDEYKIKVGQIPFASNIKAGKPLTLEQKQHAIFYMALPHILQNFDISPMPYACELLEYYIFKGELPTPYDGEYEPEHSKDFFIDIVPPDEDEQKLIRRPFIKLYIYEGVSKKDLIEFAEDRWHFINDLLKKNDKQRIIKRKFNRKKTDDIFNTQDKIIKSGVKGASLGIAAQTILKAKYPKITESLIRTVYRDEKKRRNK